MEPFNLREEREVGHFDENMNFVFKKERGEVDAWLATMDEATIEKGIGEASVAIKVIACLLLHILLMTLILTLNMNTETKRRYNKRRPKSYGIIKIELSRVKRVASSYCEARRNRC